MDKPMSNLPKVVVLIPTYNRREVVTRSINLLLNNLKYQGEVKILVGEDSDQGEEMLLDHDGSWKESANISIIKNPYRYGLGKNLNMLLEQSDSDYALQLDDDHWLIKPLDITPHVQKLMEDETAGAIRLMGIAGHKYNAQLDGQYWRIWWSSPDLYICSNRPHLKKISRFHDRYGYYPEGLRLGETEEGFCHQAIDYAFHDLIWGKPTIDVLIPLEGNSESNWQSSDQHGQTVSWQLRGF